MAGPFKIESPGNAVQLDAQGKGHMQFAVTNVSGRALRGHVRLVTQDGTAAPWLSLADAAERDFPVGAIQTFTVQVAVPADAPAGIYPFHLTAVDVANPDDQFTEGSDVSFTVTKAQPPPPPPPWLWIAIGGGVLLVIIIVVVIILLLPPPTAKLDGDWTLNFGTMHLAHNGNNVTGTYNDALNNSIGSLQGTFADPTLTGSWTGNGSGSLTLTFNRDGNTVTGSRQGLPGGPSSWCGAKGNTAFPGDCSFAGTWQTGLDGAQFTMNLTRILSDVTGTYAFVTTPTLGGTLTGTVLYNGATPVFTGTFAVVPVATPVTRSGTLQFFLNGYAGTQFQGSWVQPSPARSGAWCGWRTDGLTPVPSPVPCRRP